MEQPRANAVPEAVGYFSDAAEEFHASYDEDPNRLERLAVWRDYLDRHATAARTAYDLGCGSGILACELGRRGIDTVAIDGSETMLGIGRDLARARGLTTVRFEHRLLPLERGHGLPPADLVVSSSVLEYLSSVESALRSFRELLRPDGVLIFSVSNRDSLSRGLVRAVYRSTHRPRYFGLIRHMLTEEGIRDRLQAAGLRCVEHSYFGGADPLNRLLARVVSPRRASNMHIVAARPA